MVSPVRGDHRRFQAETPLIGLFKFAEPALNGIENGKAFLEAIGSSDAAARDVDIKKIVESITKHLADLEHEADQLWDLFKRNQKK